MRISIYSLLFLAVVLSAATAHAQQPAPRSSHIDLALTYDADRTNVTTGNSFWMQGGSAEIAGVFPHGLGVVAQVTGLHAGSISSTQLPLSIVAVTFGPRYTLRAPWHPGKHDLALFGQVLLGEAHGFDSLFPSSGSGVSNSATSLALQAGGGVNLSLSHHIALRLVQIDWLRTQLPNSSTDVQNHFRIDTGLAFRF
jgi:hypothetical protein